MATKRQRGMAFQLWIKKWLEENYPGISVHNQQMNHVCIGKGKWVSRDNDIFGCIDLIAVMPDRLPLFIQATLDRHVARKLDDLNKVRWNLRHTAVQLWIKRPDGRVSIAGLDEIMGANGSLTTLLLPVAEIVRRKYVKL